MTRQKKPRGLWLRGVNLVLFLFFNFKKIIEFVKDIKQNMA